MINVACLRPKGVCTCCDQLSLCHFGLGLGLGTPAKGLTPLKSLDVYLGLIVHASSHVTYVMLVMGQVTYYSVSSGVFIRNSD